jgi:hypothetical protein
MKTGRPSFTLKLPITIDFKVPNKKGFIMKSKTLKGRTIDDLLDCDFNIPGIPGNAEIIKVFVGHKK